MSIKIISYNNRVIKPGSLVEGKVECFFARRQKIRAVIVKIRGREYNSWKKNVPDSDGSRVVKYYGDFKFIHNEIILQGSGKMDAGKHEFIYRFLLPSHIPSSYNGRHGYIRYYLKAFIDIPMAFDPVAVEPFIVMSPINFNELLNSINLNPTQYQESTKLCICCFRSHRIIVKTILEKEAFVITEPIRLKLHVTNMSNVSVDRVIVQLKRTTKEKCTHPSSDKKIEKDVILARWKSGVGAPGNTEYLFVLQLPNNFNLANFRNCRLFEQFFKLKITVILPGCHKNMEMDIPIVLGHIPVTPVPIAPVSNLSPHSRSTNETHVPPDVRSADLPPPFSSEFANNILPKVHKSLVVPTHHTRDSSGRFSAHYEPADDPNYCNSTSTPHNPATSSAEFVTPDGKDNNISQELPPPSYYEAMMQKK